MSLANIICRALKHLRKLRGKTQDEVYEETGISVCNYEKEHRSPSVANLQILCEYYHFKCGSLIDLANASLQTGIPIEKFLDDTV